MTLVNYTLCSGLALDVVGGDLYWTSSSGHLVYRASYTMFNGTYSRDDPTRPVYVLDNPEFSKSLHSNQSAVTVVSAQGLAGDFGKDPTAAPQYMERTAHGVVLPATPRDCGGVKGL